MTRLAAKIRAARDWLAAVLGDRYAVVIDIGDRAATAFVLALITGGILDAADLFTITAWRAALAAATLAAVSVVKSAVLTWVTGSPSMLSPLSTTLRARRDVSGRRPLHRVPVRPPGRRPMPYPRRNV